MDVFVEDFKLVSRQCTWIIMLDWPGYFCRGLYEKPDAHVWIISIRQGLYLQHIVPGQQTVWEVVVR